MVGAKDIFAIGDCTATSYAPTAQVASQECAYLGRVFQQLARRDELHARLQEVKGASDAEAKDEAAQIAKRLAKVEKIRPFKYSHQGSLAYIGSDKAIADLPFFNGNVRGLSCSSCCAQSERCERLTSFVACAVHDAVGDRRCGDVPVLAQRVHQHALLAAQPHARRLGLAQGQALWTVSLSAPQPVPAASTFPYADTFRFAAT